MSVVPFSLLLPIYRNDSAQHFARAFASSVVDQDRRPAQVVIVQDGPVPAPLRDAVDAAVAESPVPADLVVLDQNLGLAVALEAGLDRCVHEIVARMDADDISLPSRFARQLPVIEAGADIVGSGMLEFLDDPGAIVARREPPVGHEAISAYARFHDPFNHPTVVYRQSAVRAAGGYQPLGLMEDYWLFARMIHAGARLANLADPLVMYRVSEGAYRRRGGLGQLRAELALQRRLRRLGFTTGAQYVRNVGVRGGYRLVPEALRRFAYRRVFGRPVAE